MLTNDKLDNYVVRKNLSSIKPNKLNIGFGVDPNHIKGVNHFPIYNDPSGLGSRAHPKVDSTLFSSNPSKSLTIKNIHHVKPPLEAIKTLYDYDAGMTIHDQPNDNKYKGLMNKMYGLPDKTMNFENFAAEQADMVGITNKQFQKKQWRAEGGEENDNDEMNVDDIMNNHRMQEVMSASSSSSSSSSSASSSSSSSHIGDVGGGPVGPRHDLTSRPPTPPRSPTPPPPPPVIRVAFKK